MAGGFREFDLFLSDEGGHAIPGECVATNQRSAGTSVRPNGL